MPDISQTSFDTARLGASCKALALSDLQSRGPYGSDYRGEQQRQIDIEYANTRWREWQDDAEACIGAYLDGGTVLSEQEVRDIVEALSVYCNLSETVAGEGWDNKFSRLRDRLECKVKSA